MDLTRPRLLVGGRVVPLAPLDRHMRRARRPPRVPTPLRALRDRHVRPSGPLARLVAVAPRHGQVSATPAVRLRTPRGPA